MVNIRRLKAEIVACYGTQIAFSKAIDWHQNKVSNMIRGKYKPNTDEVAKITELLGLDEKQYCEIFMQ